MKKKIVVLAGLILLTLMGCGESKSEKKVIGMAQESNAHPFRIAETNSVKEAAEKAGYKFMFTDGENDLAKQVANVDNLIAQGVDYIVIAPRESEGFEEVFAKAKKAKVPVILIDRATNGKAGEDFTAVITSDFIWEGEQAAKWLIENSNGKKLNIVELAGTPGASVSIDRNKGFMNIVNENPDKLEIITSQVGDFYRETAQKVMANIIQAQGKKINAVYAHNDEMALGAVAAIKEAGMVPGKDIFVIGVDGQKEAKEAIEKGEMNVTITCDPHFGDIVIENIKKLEAGEKVEPIQKVIDKVYDAKNIKEYTNAF